MIARVKRQPVKADAANFSQDQAEWERSVFLTAVAFSVVVYRRARWDFPTLPGAIACAKEVLRVKFGKGPLVYAYNADGRQIVLDRKDWDTWLALWESQQ